MANAGNIQVVQHHAAAEESERKVTWLELFYDLIYVATLIQLGNTLSEDVSVNSFLRLVIVFIPVWWAWTGMTFYMNRFEIDDIGHRVLIYVQICALAVLGVSIGGALGELAMQFALAYAAIRVILILLYARSWRTAPHARPLIQRYMLAQSAAALLWVISAFVPQPFNVGLWLVALIIDIGNSFIPSTQRLQALLPPDSGHMRERYGLFTLIVLGESFIKTVSAAAGFTFTATTLLVSSLGIGVVFSLWWLYFDDAEETAIRPRRAAPYVWIYSHLPLAIGLTAVGVASKKLFVGVAEGHFKPDYLVLYCVALILYAVSLALIDFVTVRQDGQTAQSGARLVARGHGGGLRGAGVVWDRALAAHLQRAGACHHGGADRGAGGGAWRGSRAVGRPHRLHGF